MIRRGSYPFLNIMMGKEYRRSKVRPPKMNYPEAGHAEVRR